MCRYTKYLYPLECKNNSFSNPNDLQSAIEGNKREGRTSSFGPYGGMPMQNSPLPPSLGGGIPFSMMNTMSTPPRPLHMNGNRPPMHPGESLSQPVTGRQMCLSGRQIHLEFQSGVVSSSARKLQQSLPATDTFLCYIWSELHPSTEID